LECFYSGGLTFSCRSCSACCRYEPGYVFLSVEDLAGLAEAKEVSPDEFVGMYCRWVLWTDEKDGTMERLSLRERTTGTGPNRSEDCIFWREKCTVYEARPLQCRTYPFWAELLASEEAWRENAENCPGVGGGEWHSMAEIDGVLALERARRIITRPPGPAH
jgi:Fe-S-cluster containining protein